MATQVTLARRAHISCGRRIANPHLSDAENKNVYGSLFVPGGLGYNFILELLVTGPVSDKTGMVISLTELDRILQVISNDFDHRYLNEDHPTFRETVPTSENILLLIKRQILGLLPSEVSLAALRLFEDQDCWYSAQAASDALYMTRTYRVSALHRHHNPDLTLEENKALYGKCAGVHGHDYRLEVTVKNNVDPKTGLLYARDQMDETVKREVVDVFHGSMLNEVIGNTSGELILTKFQERLKPALSLFHSLRVRETRKNHFSSIPLIEEKVS